MATSYKTAIVTGGGSGIGAATAMLLAQENWRVMVADIDEAGGQNIVDTIRNMGGIADFMATNVMHEDSVSALVEATLEKFGRLDAAVNSAGVGQRGQSIWELDADAWDHCQEINLRGMFLCIKHQSAAMVGQGDGAIVAISSAAATKGLINSSDYCAAKAGVTGLVRGAAVDCAPHNIRVNALLPGGTNTPLAERSSASTPGLAGTLRVPMNRMATPHEIAATATWLVSDAASYITGASIAVDGGMAIA
ncbi:SDR family NAD(P)-dependent oxidoreductase [Sphingopyxis yananensis]|uniref:SDR family NAD(P)-dependent oxidoreductase n=1 Tax=Sphingopyxis yananensis TaxID=2886687 RepID=UPI001D100443|nr:SDR family oxidoreductase [Sphingopyxis yananensis]MCC2602396.1 SDR family oxidoreductase [Sphingopyxis yananensis]